MALRTIGSIFIFLGFSLLFAALGWWGAFYGDIVFESTADPSALLPCLYSKLGSCAFTGELAHYAYSAPALWVALGVLALGVILRGAPRRERSDHMMPSDRLGSPGLATQLSAAPAEQLGEGGIVTASAPSVLPLARPKTPARQMRAPSSPYPPKAALHRYGTNRNIATAEMYAYADSGRSNLGVIGLGVLAAVGALVGLEASFSSFEGINEIAPAKALSTQSATASLAAFPKATAVLTRGQIFRDLQFSARGEVVGDDQIYFTTLTSSKVAVIDSPSGDYRGLLEVNDNRVHQFVIIRRSDDVVALKAELRAQGVYYDPAIAFSPDEDQVMMRALAPKVGHSLIVTNLETGASHTIGLPAFPQPKKAEPDQRNSWIFLETLRWHGDEVQYLSAFECLEPSAKKKMKCTPGEVELYAIRAQSSGAVVEAKKVAAMPKPAQAGLEPFVTDQFRMRLQAYSAALNDGSDKAGSDLKLLTDSLALFAEKHSLDGSNPYAPDVIVALFQDSPE